MRSATWKLAASRPIPVAAAMLFTIAPLPLNAATASAPPDFSRLSPIPPSQETTPRSWQAGLDMVVVPPGVYTIGNDSGPSDQRPQHEARLEGFRIDRTEVTNAAFAEFLSALPIETSGSFAAGRFDSADLPADTSRLLRESREGSGLYPIIALDDPQARIGLQDGQFIATPDYGDHPATEVTWAGARSYCRWRAARLPREVEWEAAARGPDGLTYPWGDAPPTDDLVFVSGQTGVTAPVGSRPRGASVFGVLDMAGSLAEWTSSLKRQYPYDPTDGREDPEAAGERVTRGGDYVYDTAPDELTATHRDGFSNAPGRGHRHIGFRCAADP